MSLVWVRGVHNLAARLNVNLPGMDQETGQSLAEVASHVCPYSPATTGNIDVMYSVITNGIQPLVAHSPLLGWLYHFLSVRQFSNGLGVVEVGIALLVALRPWSPKACAIGSGLAVVTFLTTLSFLFQLPDGNHSRWFPAISGAVGQFLLKDVVLLGAAIWSLAEASSAWRGGRY